MAAKCGISTKSSSVTEEAIKTMAALYEGEALIDLNFNSR